MIDTKHRRLGHLRGLLFALALALAPILGLAATPAQDSQAGEAKAE